MQQFASQAEYSVHLPGCDVATLDVVLRLLYTGHVRLCDAGGVQRMIDVCTSLGVDLHSLRNISVTIDERPSTTLPV